MENGFVHATRRCSPTRKSSICGAACLRARCVFATSVQNRRLVSMAEPHMAGMETTFTAENWSGRIEFRSALDGTVVNAGVKRYQSLANKHLEPVETERVGADAIYLKVRT